MTINLSFNSMLQRYHEYQMIWNSPVVGEELVYNQELGNSCYPYAVAAKKTIGGDLKVVSHIPRRISAICSLFIRRGGTIHFIVGDNRRYFSDLPQSRLEIPGKLIFPIRMKLGKSRN